MKGPTVKEMKELIKTVKVNFTGEKYITLEEVERRYLELEIKTQLVRKHRLPGLTWDETFDVYRNMSNYLHNNIIDDLNSLTLISAREVINVRESFRAEIILMMEKINKKHCL